MMTDLSTALNLRKCVLVPKNVTDSNGTFKTVFVDSKDRKILFEKFDDIDDNYILFTRDNYTLLSQIKPNLLWLDGLIKSSFFCLDIEYYRRNYKDRICHESEIFEDLVILASELKKYFSDSFKYHYLMFDIEQCLIKCFHRESDNLQFLLTRFDFRKYNKLLFKRENYFSLEKHYYTSCYTLLSDSLKIFNKSMYQTVENFFSKYSISFKIKWYSCIVLNISPEITKLLNTCVNSYCKTFNFVCSDNMLMFFKIEHHLMKSCSAIYSSKTYGLASNLLLKNYYFNLYKPTEKLKLLLSYFFNYDYYLMHNLCAIKSENREKFLELNIDIIMNNNLFMFDFLKTIFIKNLFFETQCDNLPFIIVDSIKDEFKSSSLNLYITKPLKNSYILKPAVSLFRIAVKNCNDIFIKPCFVNDIICLDARKQCPFKVFQSFLFLCGCIPDCDFNVKILTRINLYDVILKHKNYIIIFTGDQDIRIFENINHYVKLYYEQSTVRS